MADQPITRQQLEALERKINQAASLTDVLSRRALDTIGSSIGVQPPRREERPSTTKEYDADYNDPIRSSLAKLASAAWTEKVRDFSAPSLTRDPGKQGEEVLTGATKTRFNKSMDDFSEVVGKATERVRDRLGTGGPGTPLPPDKDKVAGGQGDDRFARLLDALEVPLRKPRGSAMPSVWPDFRARDVVGDFDARPDLLQHGSKMRDVGNNMYESGFGGAAAKFLYRGGKFLSGLSDAIGGGALATPLGLGIKTAEEMAKHLVGSIGGTISHTMTALKSERFGEIGANIFGAIRSASGLGVVAGPAGMVGGAVTNSVASLGEAVMRAIDGLQQWTESLHKSNMRFAEFSAAMANVEARQIVRDVYLNRERGDRRSPFAEELAESKNRLEKQTSKGEDIWANIKNQLSAWFNTYLAEKLEGVSEGVEELKKVNPLLAQILEYLLPKGGKGDLMDDFLNDIVTEGWDRNYSLPPRFGPFGPGATE